MQLPMQPATETIKRIFDLLVCAPSYPTEIHNKTGLHGDTVSFKRKERTEGFV